MWFSHNSYFLYGIKNHFNDEHYDWKSEKTAVGSFLIHFESKKNFSLKNSSVERRVDLLLFRYLHESFSDVNKTMRILLNDLTITSPIDTWQMYSAWRTFVQLMVFRFPCQSFLLTHKSSFCYRHFRFVSKTFLFFPRQF